MRKISILALAALVSLLAAQPMHLLAADGAIPIWEPTTIGEPGHYIVTRNIEGVAEEPVIDSAGPTSGGTPHPVRRCRGERPCPGST